MRDKTLSLFGLSKIKISGCCLSAPTVSCSAIPRGKFFSFIIWLIHSTNFWLAVRSVLWMVVSKGLATFVGFSVSLVFFIYCFLVFRKSSGVMILTPLNCFRDRKLLSPVIINFALAVSAHSMNLLSFGSGVSFRFSFGV